MSALVIRPAHKEDCTDIARLFLTSSDGLAAYIWSRFAKAANVEEASLIEIGAARYARDGVEFSYSNCVIAERNGRIVGMLHGFPMQAPDGPPEAESDPVLRPYSELEDLGSFYVSGIAVYEPYRGRGIGTALIGAAHRQATFLGCPRISLICFDANRGARNFYSRLGFAELARRPIHPHPTLHYVHGDAVLLARPVDRNAARFANQDHAA